MPSPFPGMNPYLEQADVWADFHQSFIVALRNALRAQLDPRYIVKIEEQLYVHEPPAPKRFLGRADVSAAAATKKKRSKPAAAAVRRWKARASCCPRYGAALKTCMPAPRWPSTC